MSKAKKEENIEIQNKYNLNVTDDIVKEYLYLTGVKKKTNKLTEFIKYLKHLGFICNDEPFISFHNDLVFIEKNIMKFNSDVLKIELVLYTNNINEKKDIKIVSKDEMKCNKYNAFVKYLLPHTVYKNEGIPILPSSEFNEYFIVFEDFNEFSILIVY